MKNILVIDGAINCVYDIFAATDEEFELIFSKAEDIAFAEEVWGRCKSSNKIADLDLAYRNIWARRVAKEKCMGIHGTLFFELEHKKIYYPTRRDEEAVNPDGTLLRAR